MDRLTDNTRYCFMICAGAEHPIDEDCEIYNVCYERKMHEKLAHYEDLEESGRLVVLPEGYNTECLHDALRTWEAALKGE